MQNDKGKAPILRPGTEALIWKPNIADGKLSKSWAGPYTVKKRISKDTYVLACLREKKNFRRHIRHLRPLNPSATADAPEPAFEQTDPDNEKIDFENQENYPDEFDNRPTMAFPFAEYPSI